MIGYILYFFQLIKVRIIILVAFTAVVGFVLAPVKPVDWQKCMILVSILFVVGSSAALMNNLIDDSIDRKMNRTEARKIAIDTLGKNFLWGVSLIFLFTGVLSAYIFFDGLTLVLLLISFFSYVIWYSIFLKRKNAFGVILGGLPGAIPLPIGYAATGHNLSITIILMFTYMMLWQPPHFWLLSLYNKEDYQKAGIPVLPLVYGDKITYYFIYMYSVSLIPVALITCFVARLNPISYLIILLFGVYFLVITFRALKKTNNYKKAFKASLVYLVGYMSTLLFDSLILKQC